jgi:hypothetical protein
MEPADITEDIVIKNGDLNFWKWRIHIQNILRTNKGFFFETPLIGVGIINELKGSSQAKQT